MAKILRETFRPRFDVVLVLDVSGSMAGQRSREMYRAVREVLQSLHKDDCVSIILFNSTAKTLFGLTPVQSISFPGSLGAHVDASTESFVCSGGTALWDSIADGLHILAERSCDCTTVTEPRLIVMTDGEDTNSNRESPEGIATMLREPGSFARDRCGRLGKVFANFHAVCISVGSRGDAHIDHNASIFSGSGKPNLHHFYVTETSDISRCFRNITMKFLVVKIVISEETTFRLRNSAPSGGHQRVRSSSSSHSQRQQHPSSRTYALLQGSELGRHHPLTVSGSSNPNSASSRNSIPNSASSRSSNPNSASSRSSNPNSASSRTSNPNSASSRNSNPNSASSRNSILNSASSRNSNPNSASSRNSILNSASSRSSSGRSNGSSSNPNNCSMRAWM